MNRSLFARICWGAALVLLIVPLAVRFAAIQSASIEHLRTVVDFLFDDGYYYLSMAANLADTGRSTMDGHTLTNGYQPLWLLVLAGWGRLVGTSPWTYFAASCGLIYLIAAVAPLSALAWWRSSRRNVALAMATGLAIIAIQQPELFLQGLEPILFLLVMVPLIMLVESAQRGQLVALSGVLSLAFLVRLDALALFVGACVVLPLSSAAAGGGRVPGFVMRSIGIVLRLAVFVIPVVVAYLLINKLIFGSAVPVSGIAKMIGGPKFSNWGIAAEFFARWKSIILLLVVLAPLEVLLRRAGRVDTLFYRSFCLVSLAALIQCFYYCAFSTWNVWPWYSYLVAFDMAIIAARILYVSALLCEVPGIRAAAYAGAAVLGAWMFYRSAMMVKQSVQPVASRTSFNQLSLTMLDDFFAGADQTVIAMGDRAGGLAYWGRSRISIVQTEGLTMGIDYLQARMDDQGSQFLEQHYPIQYFVIDREFTPTITSADGQMEYVVPDPIQGRIVSSLVPVFCFPQSAIKYHQTYQTQFGVNARTVFAFGDRTPCSPQALALVKSAEAGTGLRRLSLPSEYSPSGKMLD